MKILAFGHQKRVGKDTAAGFAMTLVRTKNLARRAVKAGFADKVKQIAYELYAWGGLMPGPWYEESINAHLREVPLQLIGMTPRQIWIAIGMGMREIMRDDTWYKYLFHNVKADFLVISDMRFPCEADYIKSLGGTVVKISRASVPHTSDRADDPLLNYDGWTHTINNDADLNYLYACVSDIIKGMY